LALIGLRGFPLALAGAFCPAYTGGGAGGRARHKETQIQVQQYVCCKQTRFCIKTSSNERYSG